METSTSTSTTTTTKPAAAAAAAAVATESSSSSNNNNNDNDNGDNNVDNGVDNVDDVDNVNHYNGWTIPSNNYEIERLEVNNTNNNNSNKTIITPELFYERYVRQRKPVILCCSNSSNRRSSTTTTTTNNNNNHELDLFLQTILGNNNINTNGDDRDTRCCLLQKWTNLDYLTKKVVAGQTKTKTTTTTTTVMVEKRDTNFDTFGKGNEIEMSFENFINLIKNGDTKHYLTTQDVEATTTLTKANKPSNNNNNDDDDDHNDDDGDDGDDYDDDYDGESEGLGGRPDLMSPFMKHLKDDFPLRPQIMGNLIPQNINLWIGGNSQKATTSGLHHDYHDNLYLVLKGQKRFRLYSPADTTKMYTRGKLLKVHTNGRINYVGEETTAYGTDLKSDMAAKASREKELAERLLIKAEQDLQNNIPGAQQQLENAELAMDNALQALLDAEISDNDNDDDDEDESDGDDNEEEEEEEKKNGNIDDDEADKDSKRKSTTTSYSPPPGDGDDDDDGQPPVKKQRRQEQSKKRSKQKQRKQQNHRRRRRRRIVDKTIKNPNNFSLIEPSILDNPKQLEENGYTKFKQANVAFCNINEGECLYLPASWFHEVQSSSGCNTTTATTTSSNNSSEGGGSSNTTATCNNNNNNNGYHMALNYWFHPPDAANNYEKPYSTDFWPNDYQQRFC